MKEKNKTLLKDTIKGLLFWSIITFLWCYLWQSTTGILNNIMFGITIIGLIILLCIVFAKGLEGAKSLGG